ncbi:amino acid permease [Singulisphaera sp. Ch08]|uniref:Amino acid permease n=1 Tax=Singulisphaera sp. Ch08 TaxID=3120278 RepID=A0AAU7CJZ0_9BACT
MPTATLGTSDPAPELVRELGLTDATMIVMGSMIGSGIFITSAESARLIGSPGWLLVAWLLAGLMTITGCLCCGELAAMMPKAGGQYVFLREAYGPSFGFLFGWATFLVVQTGTIAAVAVAFAKFLGVLAPVVASDNYLISPHSWGNYAISLSTQQLVAIALIIALTATNTRGLNAGKLIQNTFTFTKTAALLGLIVIGLTIGLNPKAAVWTASWWHPAQNGWDPAKAQPGFRATGGIALAMLLGRAMIGPLFSQSAWNNVTFTGGEVRNPGRNLPRALIIGCGTVVLLYLLANVAYLATLPLDQIQRAPQDRVGTAVMHAVFGRAGTIAMAVAILISTFGCVNGLILAGARVYYAMARDGLFFDRIGTTNRHHVPAVALVAQCIWACLLALPVTVTMNHATNTRTYGNLYSQLLEYLIAVDLIFYALMVGAVIALRRRIPEAERPYRTFGYPLPALIYIGLAVLIVLDLIVLAPETSGIGALIVLAGIPVYFVWSRTGGSSPAI